MSAKKRDGAKPKTTAAKVPVSAEYFRLEAAAIIALGHALRKIADEVEALPEKSIQVQGKEMFEGYGKKYIKRFILNASRALT